MIIGRPIFNNIFKTPGPLNDFLDQYYVYKFNDRCAVILISHHLTLRPVSLRKYNEEEYQVEGPQ